MTVHWLYMILQATICYVSENWLLSLLLLANINQRAKIASCERANLWPLQTKDSLCICIEKASNCKLTSVSQSNSAFDHLLTIKFIIVIYVSIMAIFLSLFLPFLSDCCYCCRMKGLQYCNSIQAKTIIPIRMLTRRLWFMFYLQ